MSERKSKCPFAIFSNFGRKMADHPHPPVSGKAAAPPTLPERPGRIEVPAEFDEALAMRTLLMHASVVKGKQGNLLILPSISLPSGDMKDAPHAILSWMGKVSQAD